MEGTARSAALVGAVAAGGTHAVNANVSNATRTRHRMSVQHTQRALRRLKSVPGAIWAVVVARAGSSAKSRLASALTHPQRQQLALAMLADVLEACTASGLHGVVAVVDTRAAARLAHVSHVVLQRKPGDMNAAARIGIAAAVQRGAETVIVLPGDIPCVSRSDIQALQATAGN